MHKNLTYKQKYAILKDWMPSIIDTVKKDIKNEHLRKDPAFIKQYLSAKNIQKVTLEDLVDAYYRAIQDEGERGEQIAEFITSRWLLKNSDVYDYFENQLSQINPDFAAIQTIESEKAKQITSNAQKTFGSPATYLFSVLNSVVFPEQIFQDLEKSAKKEHSEAQKAAHEAQEQKNLISKHEDYEREVNKLTDKYEKKLAGLQKKYIEDTEALKKQVAALQRKLSA